ncbi:MAG: hypothetical protein WB773_25520 [Isosphaeraceae bacterium]
MATIQELMEFKREEEWRQAGIPESDIRFSRLCAIDARDVRVFREYSLGARLLIVVRCPKPTARPWHGLLPPKPMATKQKTGTSGVVVTPHGRMFVSDYDLMCIWRRGANGLQKVFVSATGSDPRGPFTEEAKAIVRQLNGQLVSRIQHGCQDDYHSAKNPGVKPNDHFAAFSAGMAEHLSNSKECSLYYAKNGLTWPYDDDGKYVGPAL